MIADRSIGCQPVCITQPHAVKERERHRDSVNQFTLFGHSGLNGHNAELQASLLL